MLCYIVQVTIETLISKGMNVQHLLRWYDMTDAATAAVINSLVFQVAQIFVLLFHPLHSEVPYRCNSCRTWVCKVGGMNPLER